MDEGRSTDLSIKLAVPRGTLCIPANRLTNSYKKILCLLSNGRKGFEDNVAIIIWTDPERPRGMIRLQMKPRKVTFWEDMRDQRVLLSAVGLYRTLLSEIVGLRPAGLGKFTSESTQVDGSTPWHERVAWGLITHILFHVHVVPIVVGPFGALGSRRSGRGI